MKLIASFFFVFISTVLSLDCNGPVDVVIAVPGSLTVQYSEFIRLEKFLTDLVSYYTVSETNTHVGLVVYGREPVVIAGLGDATTTTSLNARITLLTQRNLHLHQLIGGQNVPEAIGKVHEMLKGGRKGVPKIGVMMTYGSEDLTSTEPSEVKQRIESAGKAARDDGIVMFANSAKGVVPGFPGITGNYCRLFSLGNYTGLSVLLPYLASATCYVLDPEVNPEYGNCFPEILQPPVVKRFLCGPGYEYVADPNNCAYYYQCPFGFRRPCAPGTLFDPLAGVCNHKDFVSCYSGLSCPAEKGLFRHPTDCNKYLNCYGRIPRVQSCPEGLLFNKDKQYCDFQKNVECEINESK